MHPILFHIGRLAVPSYGMLIVIGFLIGLWRAMRVGAQRMATEPADSPRRVHPDTIFDIGFFGLLIGILGARILFVALDWGSYAGHPADIFKLWQGGLSLHGGMLAGIVYMFAYCRWKKVPFYVFGDLGASSWALGYAIGRIGCLLNGCCYGGPCDLPWAVRFPDELHPGALTPPSHPTQIYATILNLLFFFWLTRWEKRPRRDGELFYAYIGMYGFYRIVVETFRAGTTSTYLIPALHLTDTHIISIVMLIISFCGIAWLRRHRPAYQDAIYARPGSLPTPTAGTTPTKDAIDGA